MRIVCFHSGRVAAVPTSWDEGFDVLVQTMNAYQDRARRQPRATVVRSPCRLRAF